MNQKPCCKNCGWRNEDGICDCEYAIDNYGFFMFADEICPCHPWHALISAAAQQEVESCGA